MKYWTYRVEKREISTIGETPPTPQALLPQFKLSLLFNHENNNLKITKKWLWKFHLACNLFY